MAIEFNNTPVLAKVKIGNEAYWLKDAEVRALLNTYGDAVKYSVDTTFATDSENLATSKAIAAYLEGAIAGLTGAMHFAGVKTEEEFNDGALAGASGDVIIVGTTEYVHDGSKWVELGDEGVYQTIAGAEAKFVQKTFTIAGLDMQDNIAVSELQTALQLKALAYADSASVTLTDYANGIKGAEYTPAGSVAVTLGTPVSTPVESKGSFTPAGTVSGNVTAQGAVTIARDNDNGFQLSGTVSAPAITVTPTTTQVQHIDSLGTLPSYTAAQYTAPSVAEATAKFASEGLVASVDANECLVFTTAATGDALTTTGFNAGSYTAAEFNAGALPTLGAAQSVLTGVVASATAPAFTGDKIAATFSGSQVDITADFRGTEGNVKVSGSYDKVESASATFSGNAATITPELVVGNKTITVATQQ